MWYAGPTGYAISGLRPRKSTTSSMSPQPSLSRENDPALSKQTHLYLESARDEAQRISEVLRKADVWA